MNLVWAAAQGGVSGDFGQSHMYRGAFTINLATGSGSVIQGVDKNAIMVLHGALMVAGWIFLLPLGTLFAKHKWVLGESKLFGVHWWFQNHRALQISGFGLFLGGMIVTWLKTWPGYNGEPTGGIFGKAHQILGNLVMGFASLQVVFAFIRPKPNGIFRPLWNQ